MGHERQPYPDPPGTTHATLFEGHARRSPRREGSDRTYDEPTAHRKSPPANDGEQAATDLPWAGAGR